MAAYVLIENALVHQVSHCQNQKIKCTAGQDIGFIVVQYFYSVFVLDLLKKEGEFQEKKKKENSSRRRRRITMGFAWPFSMAAA